MKCSCGMKNIKEDKNKYNFSRYDLLVLKRPNKLDDFIASVKKPKDAETLLKDGLPMWKRIPLDHKIPMIAIPKGTAFTCNKVGRKLWRGCDREEFDLSYNKETNFQYNPLYDEHLKLFFSKKANKRYLVEKGYITRKGEVICTLKELNDYRRYLRAQQVEQIAKARKIVDEIQRDTLRLTLAHKCARQTQDHKLRKSVLLEKTKERREREAKEREMKEHKLAMRRQRRQEYEKRYEKLREEEVQERMMRSHMRNERIRSRLANANEIELQRKMCLMRRWNQLEAERQERLRQERNNKIQNKQAKINEFWRNKSSFQEDKIKKNKSIIEEFTKDQNFNIALRLKLVQEEQIRLDELFYNIKSKGKKTGLPGKKKKAIKAAVLDKFMGSRKASIEADTNIEEVVSTALNKPGVEDIYKLVKGVQEKLEKIIVVPDAVNYAVDCILENTVREFVKKHITKIMDDVHIKAKEQITKNTGSTSKPLLSAPPSKRFSQDAGFGSRMHSRLTIGSCSLLDKPLSRGVSFGTVHTIGEIPTGLELLSTRDRPPTPVPSLTEVVAIAFSDPIPALESDVDDDTVDTGKSSLRKQLDELSKQLLKSVLKKALDVKKRSLYSLSATTFGDVAEKIADAMLSQDISDFGECEEIKQAVDQILKSLLPILQKSNENVFK